MKTLAVWFVRIPTKNANSNETTEKTCRSQQSLFGTMSYAVKLVVVVKVEIIALDHDCFQFLVFSIFEFSNARRKVANLLAENTSTKRKMFISTLTDVFKSLVRATETLTISENQN